MLDGGSQPLSVGGDDAAAGEVAEHDCMVGTSNRQREALGQGEVKVGESMHCLDLGHSGIGVTCANGTISNRLVS
jgi:hypothetical protein